MMKFGGLSTTYTIYIYIYMLRNYQRYKIKLTQVSDLTSCMSDSNKATRKIISKWVHLSDSTKIISEYYKYERCTQHVS